MKTQPSRNVLILIASFSLVASNLNSQAVLGLSAGAGAGSLKHNFTQNGAATPLFFVAPAAYFSAELAWGNIYLDMSLALLLPPSEIELGSSTADLSEYSTRLGMDFNAIGIGYLVPLNEKIGAGGALGFHVSALTFTPENTDDVSLLRFGGYYGLIGLDVVPRIRYTVSNSFRLTLNLPLGFDFGPMSEDLVVGGVTVGESAAIVQPASLVPDFTGFTAGLYLSAGYFLQLKR